MSWDARLIHFADQNVPGAQVYHQAGWDSWQRFSFYVFLLRQGDDVVLVDCGMDDPAPLNAAILGDLGEDGCIRHVETGGLIEPLLAREGIALSDVTHIALTHLHADHASNVDLFPEAKIIIGTRGWELHQLRRSSHPALVGAPAFPTHALTILDEAFDSGRLLLADDGEEILPGFRAWTIGGHTDDSTGYAADSDAGRLVFPGDSVWTFDNLERDIPVGSHIDVPGCLEALAWARSAGEVVLPSHDPLLLERYPDGLISGGAR